MVICRLNQEIEKQSEMAALFMHLILARWAHIRQLEDASSTCPMKLSVVGVLPAFFVSSSLSLSCVLAVGFNQVFQPCRLCSNPAPSLVLTMFWVYVLHSPIFDKIYIGFTSDLESRMRSHNVLATKGWTIKFRPWTLLYSETFANKALAMRREKELKSAKGRTFIRNLLVRR
jgi:putative endonuclease